MVLLFLVLCHMLLLLTLSLHKQILVFTSSVVPGLSSFVKIYDGNFFNHMFDPELPKFRAALWWIYG